MSTAMDTSSQLPPSPPMLTRPNSLLPQEDLSDSALSRGNSTSSSTSSCNSIRLQNMGKGSQSDDSLSPVAYTDISQRLSRLLWDLADDDPSYNGCELFSPIWNQSRDLLSYSKTGTVFSPMECSPSDRPWLFFERTPTPSEADLPPFLKMLNREISCDGPGQSKAMIWSLRMGVDGKLFVFNNGIPVSPSGEAIGGQLHHSQEKGGVPYVHFCHGNTLMELNPKSPPSMRHSIGTIDKGMNIQTEHVDSADGNLYTFSSEALAYMALDYTDAENPVLKSFPQKKLVEIFEDLKKKGESLSQAKINPLVNIWYAFQAKIALPNQIALFYTGDKYRYYVHVDGAKLILVSKKLSDIKKDDDWKDHLQFSNNYTNPPCEEYTDTSSTDIIPNDTKVSLNPENKRNGKHFEGRLTSDSDATSPVKKLNMCEVSTSPVNGFQIPSSAPEARHDTES